jgi:hypothetical protein
MSSKLFYAAEGFPEMEPENKAPGSPGEESGSDGNAGRKPVFRVVYLQKGKPGAADLRAAPSSLPAGLKEESVDRILDDLMELDEDEQVRVFDRDYLHKFNPDDPVLAKLMGEFFYKNLGTVFLLGDELSTGFDFLEQLYYRKRSMNHFLAYARRNSRSRTGEEIFFCLAAFLDFERRCIVRLQDAKDLVMRVLTDSPPAPVNVHEKKIKAYLLRQVAKDLSVESRLLGAATHEALLKKYRDEQIAVLEKLAAGEGEGRNRALLNLGVLLWEEGLAHEALEKWRQLDMSYSTPLASRIRDIVVSESSGELTDRKRFDIDRILADRGDSDRQAFLERLIKFHRWAKRSSRL